MIPLDWLSEPKVERDAILSEHPGAAGRLLSEVLESTRTWVTNGAGSRTDSISEPVSIDQLEEHLPPIASWLGLLSRDLADLDRSDEELGQTVPALCTVVAGWAEEAGTYCTAIGYAQVAAALAPDLPTYTYHVGRLARKAEDFPSATLWLRRAHKNARGHEGLGTRALALQEIGHIHRVQGEVQEAKKSYQKALEQARKYGFLALIGDVYYDLCLMELELGNLKAALPHFDQALTLYASGDRRVSRLVEDVAWLLLDAYGAGELAYRLFDALLEEVWDPPYRILLHACRARAAAGAGFSVAFESSWNRVFAVLDTPGEDQRGHAAALVQLALGAIQLQHWTRAHFALVRACEVAREDRDEAVRSTAMHLARALSGAPADQEHTRLTSARFTASSEELDPIFMQALGHLRGRDRGEVLSPLERLIGTRDPETADVRL